MDDSAPSKARPREARRRLILFSALLLALILWLLAGGISEAADRFGEPWQALIVSDHAITHRQPDPNAAVIGPLGQGAMVIAVNETTGADGAPWTNTTVGWLPSSELRESNSPWIAEVTTPTLSVYAYPDSKGPIRITARQGGLLRVEGAALGVNGDNGIWWATTQGFVSQDTIRPSYNPWAQKWTMPSAAEAQQGWWGQLVDDANVRAGPTTDSPIVGDLPGGSRVKVLSEQDGESVQGDPTWYRIDGGRFAGAWVHRSLIQKIDPPAANTTAPAGHSAASWIVVDRKASSLTFVQAGQPAFVTYVSLGKVGRETPTGVYQTFAKFVADRMTSRSLPNEAAGYDLPNVPFTQYYTDGGAAIHGTYWHDEFGSAESHGCINLTSTDSAYLFTLTEPHLSDGQTVAYDQSGAATPVVIVN